MPAPNSTSLTLVDLVEPLLQYICRLNRAARHSAGSAPRGDTAFFTKSSGPAQTSAHSLNLDYEGVRSEIRDLLKEIPLKAASDYRLAEQAKKLEMPLIFFVDSILSESKLPFASEWNQNRLAYEHNELAGDQAFFDLLEETLKDPSDDASERLAVFYLCIGLGFTGIYFRQPEYLRKTTLAIAPRIRRHLDSDQAARMCPEAYEGIDTRDLVQPPSHKLVVLTLLFVCFTVAAVGSYIWMYQKAKTDLNASIQKVLDQDPAKK